MHKKMSRPNHSRCQPGPRYTRHHESRWSENDLNSVSTSVCSPNRSSHELCREALPQHHFNSRYHSMDANTNHGPCRPGPTRSTSGVMNVAVPVQCFSAYKRRVSEGHRTRTPTKSAKAGQFQLTNVHSLFPDRLTIGNKCYKDNVAKHIARNIKIEQVRMCHNTFDLADSIEFLNFVNVQNDMQHQWSIGRFSHVDFLTPQLKTQRIDLQCSYTSPLRVELIVERCPIVLLQRREFHIGYFRR